jgi:hypothetical protein
MSTKTGCYFHSNSNIYLVVILWLLNTIFLSSRQEQPTPFLSSSSSVLFQPPRAVMLNIKINTATLPIHKNFISQKSPASALLYERATLQGR